MSEPIPANLLYAESHEWVRVERDVATVGITHHAQQELTEIVFVELPPLGAGVVAKDACAVIESVKTATDICSPVSGEIVRVNQEVEGNPALINERPYEDGWIFQMKISDRNELSNLMKAEQYAEMIA